jgi:hypothetical protein
MKDDPEKRIITVNITYEDGDFHYSDDYQRIINKTI